MTIRRSALIVATVLCLVPACVQAAREPNIGYLYPAGGQRGTTFRMVAGGMNLRGAMDLHFSGEGVHATYIEYWPPLSRFWRGKAGRHIRELIKLRVAERAAKASGRKPPDPAITAARRAEFDPAPKHPWLDDMDNMTLLELVDLSTLLFNNKAQDNAQLAEGAVFEVTIDPDATPGDRELRLITRAAMTNPRVFQIGVLPEARELEPNDPCPDRSWPPVERPEQPLLDIPVLLNGQIMPGDVDRHRLKFRRGQKLVIQAHARRLVPYLADSVPGWFQTVLAIYDTDGRELAYADDYEFKPDAVLYFEVPADGEYSLEIRDAIFRGREDFVYRISVGEQPFITSMFPLGGPAGVDTIASVTGWNLPRNEVTLDTTTSSNRVQTVEWLTPEGLCNRIMYAVDELPEVTETEPNDTMDGAQQVTLPRIVNGRIGTPGDVDMFRFQGHAGDKVVMDLMGRRLDSPIDSLVRLIDASGVVLAWNDDFKQKDGHLHIGPGMITNHSDSYLMASLPADGNYYVQLLDARGHGSEAHAYRLHIIQAQPDFVLRVMPSSLTIPAGGTATINVRATRRNGFTGEIKLALKDAPEGFSLAGETIPAETDCVEMTLTAPAKSPGEPVALQFEGMAVVDGQTFIRPAIPADDTMQAFLWRHLMPAKEMLVAVLRAK